MSSNRVLDQIRNLQVQNADPRRSGAFVRPWPVSADGLEPGTSRYADLGVQIIDITLTEKGREIKDKNITLPGIFFTYVVVDGEHSGSTYEGNPILIETRADSDLDEIEKNMKAMDEGRWAAFVFDILQRPPSSWGQDFEDLANAIRSAKEKNALIEAVVRFEVFRSKPKSGRGGEARTYDNQREYMVEVLPANTP